MATKALLSDVSYVRLSLAESNGERVKVRGEFAKCGIATENKRVYPKQVWEKEIKRLNKALKERRVFGEVDHPSDGQTKLARVSHIVTELRVEDGLVVGEAEVLPTDSGRNLLALLKANIPVGVSSRGFGSVKANDKGEDIVQEDYKLVTFDFVADPADVDAIPQVSESRRLFEGVEFDADDEQEKAIEFARRVEAEITAQDSETAQTSRESIANDIIQSLASLRAEVREEVRQELLGDPSLAGAKAALESVREILRPFILPEDAKTVVESKDAEIQKLQRDMAEQALRIKDLEAENTSLASMAKEVGYRFYLERILSNDPHADSVRNLVGDVKAFENSDALKARVAQVKAEISRHASSSAAVTESKEQEVAEAKEQEAELRRAFDAKLAEIDRRVTESEEEREALVAALEEARKENKELSDRLYAEERLANHPKAAKLRSLAERVNATSKRDIDALLESEREPVRDEDDLQNIRARIRSRMHGGSERVPEGLTEAARPARIKNGVKDDYQELGISLDSLRRLSGITNKQ